MASSGPVAFLLDYAASLGITKDITKTQAYSVWLQGNDLRSLWCRL